MIVALISRKGGVGKTTTAINLGAALAARGRRVLLVDLDSQSSASLGLGVDRRDLAPSSADVLLSGLAAHEAVRSTSCPGLSLIPASVDLMSAESELNRYGDAERRLARALAPLRDEFDLIFLDCPPSLSLIPTNALVASDAFLVPAVPHFLAQTSIGGLLRYAERLRWGNQDRARLLGILLTLVDYRNRTSRRMVEAIRGEHGRSVFALEIRVNIALAEAPENGLTIFDHDPKSTGAAAYAALAEEFELRAAALRRGEHPGGRPAPPPCAGAH